MGRQCRLHPVFFDVVIYIHIPYCRSFCTYCDFYSVVPNCGYGRFTDAVCAETLARAEEIRASVSPSSGCPGTVNTLYIGGGTPSVLPVEEIGRIVAACRAALADPCRRGQQVPFDEFTVEVNPDDIVRKGHEYVETLLGLGVDRVSMGVQSMDDRVLRWMNRRHDVRTARQAYRILRESGVGNISIDLIFGYDICSIVAADGMHPSIADPYGHWSGMLEEALDISGDGSLPQHVSAYQLSVEEGSALAALVADGVYAEAAEDVCAGQYAELCRMLGEAGYSHYEISNFALPGYEAKHNSAYWRHFPYVGIGPAAHSFPVPGIGTPANGAVCRRGSESGADAGDTACGQCLRSWNVPDVDAYIIAALSGSLDSIRESETLSPAQFREEEIMLGLRTSRGVAASLLQSDTLSARNMEKLLRTGSLVPAGGVLPGQPGANHESRLRIPESRFFVSDDIISELL